MNNHINIINRTLKDLSDSSMKTKHSQKEEIYLRLNIIFSFLGIISLISGFILLFVILTSTEGSDIKRDETILLWFTGFLLFAGMYLCLSYYTISLKCNSTNIVIKYFFKTNIIVWDDIKNISFLNSSGLVYIHLKNGNDLKTSLFMVHLIDFFKLVENKTGLNLEKIIKEIKNE